MVDGSEGGAGGFRPNIICCRLSSGWFWLKGKNSDSVSHIRLIEHGKADLPHRALGQESNSLGFRVAATPSAVLKHFAEPVEFSLFAQYSRS